MTPVLGRLGQKKHGGKSGGEKRWKAGGPVSIHISDREEKEQRKRKKERKREAKEKMSEKENETKIKWKRELAKE